MSDIQEQQRLLDKVLIDKLEDESEEDWTDTERLRIGGIIERLLKLVKQQLKQAEKHNKRERKREKDYFAEFDRQLQEKIGGKG